MYNVLLVDDEYMILEGLKHLLPWEELGFKIVGSARSGQQALDFLAKQKVDLMITDITMPEMSGIDLIEEAQKRGHHFKALILSGYQEFNYVKQGIRLGIKNYLVKPVDKEELKKSVLDVKELLKTEAQQKIQGDRYVRSALISWLNDELNETEFQDLFKQLQLEVTGPFTAVKIGTVEEEGEILNFLKQQVLYLENFLGKETDYLLVYLGPRKKLFQELYLLKKNLQGKSEILVGETVATWENLYESYEKVQQLERLSRFYPDLFPEKILTEIAEKEENSLSFLSFNKALMIGDAETILKEVRDIFQDLTLQKAPPEYVRYVSFLLYSDLARQFPQVFGEDFSDTLEEIRHSANASQLETLLTEALRKIKTQPVAPLYSEMVQKALAKLEETYAKDWTLKSMGDVLHLNPVYFGQLFKKETGKSFSQYLNQLRIKKAQKLLLYSDKNINEIAEETGYNNTNYFSKMFKKLNGITPKEFRETYEHAYFAVEEVK